MPANLQLIAEKFRNFADAQIRVTAPLYSHLTVGVADMPDVLELVSTVIEGQPYPNLLFGAVHYLLLEGADHPLRDYYPNFTQPVADGDALPVFRDFCRQHAEAIREIVSTRIVQTNEVGRSALLFPGFQTTWELGQEKPLALIEVGASAGLNLLWDKFHISYSDGQQYTPAVNSDVYLNCHVTGSLPSLRAESAPVAWRIGLDMNPLYLVDNHDDQQWLRALLWPEDTSRIHRFNAAVDLQKRHPIRLLKGNALEILPTLLEEAPLDTTLCVYHSFVLYQFSADMKATFYQLLRNHAQHRDIFLLSLEWTPDDLYTMTLTHYTATSEATHHLADIHAHGRFIDWKSTL